MLSRRHKETSSRKKTISDLGSLCNSESDKSSYVKSLVGARKELRAITNDSSEKDLKKANNIVSFLLQEEREENIFLLTESVFYFENIGHFSRALQVAEMAVELAYKTPDINLRRKSHNTLGAMCSRVCDFERASSSFEKALKLAIELKHKIAEFAVLCNIVSLLEAMGLTKEAIELSKRLADYPRGSAQIEYFHLQNAITGFRLAEILADQLWAERFHNIARSTLLPAGDIGRPWETAVEIQEVYLLILKGGAEKARGILESSISKRASKGNVRVDVILYSALGACAKAGGNANEVEEVRLILESLLAKTKYYALQHEEVLRALFGLYENNHDKRSKDLSLMYLGALNEHLLNVKHRQFFDGIKRPTVRDIEYPKLSMPTYQFSSALSVAFEKEKQPNEGGYIFQVDESDYLRPRIAMRSAKGARRKIEDGLRTEQFNVAEDWAVAADYATSRPGQHCIQVGMLAGLIALKVGLSEKKSVLVEMACRLHDIGKLYISRELQSDVNNGAIDEFFFISTHTSAGHQLLCQFADPVFQLAARVALAHHEWWNGCGLPGAIRGNNIPLEARICFIADSFITFLNPSIAFTPWLVENAKLQIRCMSGVQLDPGLMIAFEEAVVVYVEKMDIDNHRAIICENAVVKSEKQKLLHQVEQVVHK